MRPYLLFFALFACLSGTKAQTGLFNKVKQLLQQTHPEIALDNKLIAINVWQLNDIRSRELNKDFEKAAQVYQVAKLKGGTKGLVVVCVSRDHLNAEAVVALSKDGIVKSVSLSLDELSEAAAIKNIVFDMYGNEVYADLENGQAYPSIQKLITR